MKAEVAPRQLIADAFARGREEGRALVMPFLVAGYPDADGFLALAQACADGGADLFEIGIPFSDPIMDGPVIAAASHSVLQRGASVDDLVGLAARAVDATGIPAVVMTYYNLLYRRGLDAFASGVAAAGVSGAIVPDLSVEESGPWRDACAGAGIAPVMLAALTSTDERLRSIGAAAEGFVYAASLLGVTGVRDTLDERARGLVERVRSVCDLPVAIGIGVSTAQHARTAAGYADGVIVGSALVRLVRDEQDPASAARAFVADLRAAAVRSG